MKIERKVTEVLRSLEKKGKLPSDLKKKVQNQNSSTPQLYGLPKIHKASVPLRPIVSSINSPTYNLSRYLAGVLSPLWGKTSHFVRNSHDFVEKIRGMDVNTEDKLISFDVKSLFTKVPIDLSLQIIRRRLARTLTWSNVHPSMYLPLRILQNSVSGQRTSCTVMSSLSRRKGQPWDLLSPRW